jgi:hypothetical protein
MLLKKKEGKEKKEQNRGWKKRTSLSEPPNLWKFQQKETEEE